MKIEDLSRSATTDSAYPSYCEFEYLPYQNAGIEYALKFNNVLFADEPGLGKTAQTIGTINERGLTRVFVVCPASLRETTWVPQIKRWSNIIDPKIKVLYKLDDIQPFEDINYYICSYEFVAKRKNLGSKASPNWVYPNLKAIKKNLYYEALVIDECHYLKSTSANRTRVVFARDGLRQHAEFVFALTGTPIVNRPIELYTTIKALFPEVINNKDYFSYGMRYCNGFKRKVTRFREAWDFNGASNLKELGTKLRQHGMVRRKKVDVLSELPEKMRNIVFINDKKIKYKIFNDSVDVGNIPSIEFTEASSQRRELGESKIDFAVDYISTQLESGHEKVIIFAHHKNVIEGLHDGLKSYGVVEIRGSTPAAERQKAVENFQGIKNVRVFLGNIKAAGVGLTLTAASYVVIVEPAWEPGVNEQAEDRAHRVGQKNSVMVDYLVHEGSIDARIVESVIKKSQNITELLE